MTGKSNNYGFTLPELIITLGILGVLFSITVISLLQSQRVSARDSQLTSMITDIRDTQNKATMQKTGGGGTNYDFGIYLESGAYTVFQGSAYSTSDPANFRVELDPSLTITNNTLPNSSIVFEKGSGVLVGYTAGFDAFDLVDITNGQAVNVSFNRYGIPIE